MDTRIHGVQGVIKGTALGAICVYLPKHLHASLGNTAAHSNANAGSAAAAVIVYGLGNKDEKNVYRLGIDILFLDIPDSWLQSWIWKQWIWSAEFPFMIQSTVD